MDEQNPIPETVTADGREAPPSDTQSAPTSTPQGDGSAGSRVAQSAREASPEPTQSTPVIELTPAQSAADAPKAEPPPHATRPAAGDGVPTELGVPSPDPPSADGSAGSPEPSPAESPQPAPGAEIDAQTPQDTPQPSEEPQTVPLARLQGVQRQLNQAERDRDSWQGRAQVLEQQLTAANQRAATELAERIRATHRDIVPSLIQGSTIEQVETSLQHSRAAFAAAQQAYARTIPVPAGNPAAAVPNDQPSLSPLQMISAGLRQPKSDINR